MDAKLIHKLSKRAEEGTLRSLSCFEGLIDFCSNDYLGLAKHSAETTEITSGSTGSRLISGTSRAALDCESFLTEYFSTEAALVFNSGYDANLGFFGSVPQKGDTIIYDQLIHASVRDGIRLSHAKALSFTHNSLEDLQKKLHLAEGTIYVTVESMYSMDGDLAPLKEIVDLCAQFKAYVVVDEAHASGVLGKGLVDELGINRLVFARLVTFGKAYGAHGAAIIGSLPLKDYLVNFARSFIYTTALPPSTYQLIQQRCSLDLTSLQSKLHQNIQIFRKIISTEKLFSNERSPIQIIQMVDVLKTRELADKIQSAGFAVKPIYSPTVPKGEERIRICLHAFNTEEEIISLASLLN